MLLKCDRTIPERERHFLVKESGKGCTIACNVPTTPGDMTERGCTYAGCRGVVGGPVKDVIQLTHGPIGCSYYSWGYRPHLADSDFHIKYSFTTDMREENIIFGGEKRLYQSIVEAHKAFPQAKGVFVYNSCATALIGDDGDDVAKRASAELGIPVVFFHCEGFRGVSQSQGHHVGNKTIFDKLVGTKEPPSPMVRGINIVGDYNIKRDIETYEPLLKEMGVEIVARFTGNASIDEVRMMHRAKLNVVHCARSAMYIAKMMEEKYGIPHISVTLYGIKQTSEALLEIASFFGLEERAKPIIQREVERITPEIERYRERLKGKKVFVYQGAPRAWHWVRLMEELGMEVTTAATTFGHEDDYEKIYARVKDGALLVDNPNALELEEILLERRPDLFVSGNKEKYISYKLGVPFVNGHTYETGPYEGFSGLVKFARDMDRAVNSPVWKLVRELA